MRRSDIGPMLSARSRAVSDHSNDFRNFERTRTRRAAWIIHEASRAPIPCVLWDISDGGARITAAHSSTLPDAFTLLTSQDGEGSRRCRVVWRKMPHIGVEYMTPSQSDVMPCAQSSESVRSGAEPAVSQS
jgi:hypothetical protein